MPLNYITDESEFVRLAPGENHIEYGSAGGAGYIEIGGQSIMRVYSPDFTYLYRVTTFQKMQGKSKDTSAKAF